MVDSGNTYGERVSRLISWGHWFAFFNIIASLLIGTRYISQAPWPETFMGDLYLVLSWFGHFSFLVFALYLLTLFPLSFIVPSRKLYRFLAVTFASVGLTLLLLDTQAYQQIHLHLSPVVLELLFEKDQSNIATEFQQLFVVLPVIFLLQLVLSEWIWRKQRRISKWHIGKPATVLFFLAFTTSHLIYIWADAVFYEPITAQKANFPLSYPMTAKSFMQKYGILDRDEYAKRRELNEINENNVSYPTEPLQFDQRGKKLNVLMVMVDNLRADYLSAEHTPALYKFQQQNISFANHYSSNNNNESLFGLFYGIPNSYKKSIKIQQLSPLFVDVMKDQGYSFGVFHSNDFKDNYYKSRVLKNSDVTIPEYKKDDYDDRQAISDWGKWVEESGKHPWFSYLELASINDFEENDSNSKGSPEQQLKAAYQQAANRLDQVITTLFSRFEQLGILEDTIVIITSNHGSEFNETQTNSWGASTNYSRYQLGVPLLIHWPGKPAAQYTHKSSHFDLSVTLMQDLLGVSSNPKSYSSGRNLFNTNSRRWVLAGDNDEIAVISDRHTTVVDKYGNYKVYDANYKRQKDSKTKLSILMQGLSELKRFYTREQR